MCDGKNKHAFRVKFECDQVRELLEKGLPNRNGAASRRQLAPTSTHASLDS
jgi:hypothetical protein